MTNVLNELIEEKKGAKKQDHLKTIPQIRLNTKKPLHKEILDAIEGIETANLSEQVRAVLLAGARALNNQKSVEPVRREPVQPEKQGADLL